MYDSKVYTEVYEIINMLSDKNKEKIPEKLYKLIEAKRDKDYEFDARDEDTILLPDTEKVLSAIYTDYLATEGERKIIRSKENSFINKIHNAEMKNERLELKRKNPKDLIKYEDGFLNKIFNRIKNFFRLR